MKSGKKKKGIIIWKRVKFRLERQASSNKLGRFNRWVKKLEERERERKRGKRGRKPRHLWNNQINRIESIETFKMNYIFLINEKLANSAAQQITPTALHFQFFPDYYVRLLLPLFRSPPIFSSLRKKKHGSSRCFKVEREKRERKKRRNLEKIWE